MAKRLSSSDGLLDGQKNSLTDRLFSGDEHLADREWRFVAACCSISVFEVPADGLLFYLPIEIRMSRR